MIAVTCRNGEQFSIDPSSIERIETDPDTVVHLVDGRKYVIDEPFDELLRRVRDHRAAFVVASNQLTRTATRSLHPSLIPPRNRGPADSDPPPLRVERRRYRRDEPAPATSPAAEQPGDDES